MDFNNILEQIKGDPEKASAIIFDLGISMDDFKDNYKAGRIYEVINHLMKVQDPRYYINTLTVGKQVDKIDHLWTFFSLRDEKIQVEEKLFEVNTKLEEMDGRLIGPVVAEADRLAANELIEQRTEIESRVSSLDQQLAAF